MVDGYRHNAAVKAHIFPYPCQVTGKIVYMTGACTPGGCGGIVPVPFQTVIITDLNAQLGSVGCAGIGGIKLTEPFGSTVFYGIRHFDHQAVIPFGIPIPDNIRYVPRVPALTFHVLVVGDILHKVRLLIPLDTL